MLYYIHNKKTRQQLRKGGETKLNKNEELLNGILSEINELSKELDAIKRIVIAIAQALKVAE